MSEHAARTHHPSRPPSPRRDPAGPTQRSPLGEGEGEACTAVRDRPCHVTVMNRQRRLLPLDSDWLRRVLVRVAAAERLGRSAVNVVLVSDRQIRRLNRDFHGQAEVTDVLTFDYGPAGGEDDVDAEVVVSAERALAEALSRGLPPDGELLLYCIHGLLHLAGHEDGTVGARQRMWRRQLWHLARAGFPARRWKDSPRAPGNLRRTESKR